MSDPQPRIHPTACIDSGAKLASDVRVGPYSIIGPDVSIGPGTRIQSHAVIERHTTIGSNGIISHHATVGIPPQDFTYAGEPTRLVIGDEVRIGEYVNISRGTIKGGGQTTIGNRVYLMAYSHVGHDSTVEDDVILTNGTALAGHVLVEEKAYLSANASIHQFCRVGTLAMISGNSIIIQDVAPYTKIVGLPGKLVGLNLVGLRRAGLDQDEIRALKQAYTKIFDREIPLEHALEQARTISKGNTYVNRLIEFFENSQRGVIRTTRK